MSPDYYARIGRVLEAGKFQLAFFDDRLGMPEFHGGRFAEAVAHGIRCVKMDPIACLMPMAMSTERLGLGTTYSTTYYHPFHVARLFQTLDLMTRGRAAWNVVTSMNDVEARNMGLEEVVEHDARYDRADEFLEVVHGHWDTWADDALIVDKTTGRFADPEKVHRLGHRGQHFNSRGPFTVPRSPQGHPVVIQAGQSGRGRRFAARWGELIFTSNPSLEPSKKAYAELKADAARLGRNPEHMKIATLCHPVVAATKAEAEDKFALIERLPLEVDSLMLLSENSNFDFGSKPLDEPFTDAELARFTGTQSHRDRVVAVLGDRKPTPRDFITITRRGKLPPPWVGGPEGGRRHLRGVVLGTRLRRLRRRRGVRARQLRGFRHVRHPGAAAPRALPEGLQGRDAEGEPRPAAACRGSEAIGEGLGARMQEIATGYGLIEGPVWDRAKGLYFSDVLGGGIYLLDRTDKVSLAVPKRRGIGGMALHADGGLVAGGRDIVHVSLADHSMKVLLDAKAAGNAVGFNDLTTDAEGRVYVGSIAFAIFKGEEAKPGNLYVIDTDGRVRQISDGSPADQRPRLLARRPAALSFRRPPRARPRLRRWRRRLGRPLARLRRHGPRQRSGRTQGRDRRLRLGCRRARRPSRRVRGRRTSSPRHARPAPHGDERLLRRR